MILSRELSKLLLHMGWSDEGEFEHIYRQILLRRHLVCTADCLHEQERWILMRSSCERR